MPALHTGRTPACASMATTFHSRTAMNNSHTRIHVSAQAHACKSTHLEAWDPQRSTCTHTCSDMCSKTKAICSISLKWIHRQRTRAYKQMCAAIFLHSVFSKLSDTLHTNTHTSPDAQWIPEHTQAICSISSIQCVLSSCQQTVSVFSCQANSPTSSQ